MHTPEVLPCNQKHTHCIWLLYSTDPSDGNAYTKAEFIDFYGAGEVEIQLQNTSLPARAYALCICSAFDYENVNLEFEQGLVRWGEAKIARKVMTAIAREVTNRQQKIPSSGGARAKPTSITRTGIKSMLESVVDSITVCVVLCLQWLTMCTCVSVPVRVKHAT